MYEKGEVKAQTFECSPGGNWITKDPRKRDVSLEEFLRSVCYVNSESSKDRLIVFYTESKTKFTD